MATKKTTAIKKAVKKRAAKKKTVKKPTPSKAPAAKTASKKKATRKKAVKKKAAPKKNSNLPDMVDPDAKVTCMLKPEKKKGPGAGRPTKYKPEYCEQMLDYFQNAPEYDETPVTHYGKDGGVSKETMQRHYNAPPMIEEFAEMVEVARSTIYHWATLYPEFSDTLERCQTIEMRWIKKQGLLGEYNSTIAKLLLGADHDTVEKKAVDHTTGGDKINSGGTTNFVNYSSEELMSMIVGLSTSLKGQPVNEYTATDG